MLTINFHPFPLLTTERLILRQLVVEDEDAIYTLRSNEKVNKYLTRAKYKSREEAKTFINIINTNISNNESGYWAIRLKNSDRVIGTICLWNISKENYRAEIGFELHPDFQKQGFMQEAVAAVIEYGFKSMKLHSIVGDVDPDNKASIKLLEKNKFVREAYFRESIYYKGKFLDTAIYTLLNPDE